MIEVKPRSEFLAYFAGLLDGSGTICIAYKKKEDNYVLCLTVNDESEECMKALVDKLGGKYNRCTNYGKGYTQKFCWRIASADAIGVLRSIAIYAINKKKLIELALQFGATINERVKPTPPEFKAIRKQIYYEMKSINLSAKERAHR